MIYIALIVFWFGSGFVGWCFEDGYLTWKHPSMRKQPPLVMSIIFALAGGPGSLVSAMLFFRPFHWTRRFWSKNQKDGWDMLEKLERN